MGKRDDIQVTSKPNTYDSFVSQGANFEYEIDITDMASNYATSNARYGLVAIDIILPKLPRYFQLKIEHLKP